MHCNIWSVRSLALLLITASGVDACQRVRHEHSTPLVKRQSAPLTPLTPDEDVLVRSVSSTTLSEWSYYYTHGQHLAGKNQSMAQWTADRWTESGIASGLVSYNVYLNYPVSKSLCLRHANGSVIFEPALEEAVLDQDDTSSYPDRVPTFHGYSATGNASAEYVYVGRGQRVDFQRLLDLGVPLEGKIALARYGGPFRGLKVKNAQEHGMVAAVLFTDPADDGDMTEAKGHAAYPDGPARNPSAVQRGSVQFVSTYPGDPTTPGYASKEGVPRTDSSVVTPRIPSIPISYADAIPLLAALDGHGTTGAEVNRTGWVGALNVTYSTGPAPGTVLDLSNVMEDKITDIWNAVGIINGTIYADETIIIGNHRDAWIVGGAADPNSGTAIIVELAKALGQLVAETGWKPKRNIVLCSWDGEEYGMLGSTEWVEEYLPWLNATAVSYLNIDIGTSGPHPYLSATPELHDVTVETMKKVVWRETNRTMFDVWNEDNQGYIEPLGSGSDYTAFVHSGIGSVDIGSGNGESDPVYHYHSNFDSYHWMTTYGDPGFVSHKSMAQYLTLLAYKMADADLIPFNVSTYSTEMNNYFADLEKTVNSTSSVLDLSPLRAALDDFTTQASALGALQQRLLSGPAADDTLPTLKEVNQKSRDFQRGFVSQGGLPGREFYKHVVFAPGVDTGYAPTTFPGITEALVESRNVTLAEEWVQKTAAAIKVAADIVKP
ncbi:N-acetylated-alpha-linked acidic dipeptidase-like protein 2 [Apiospora rasikravindrae]|uniref:N-acetylated-alpha-linked acidic dipeptidase-like protein 2 n=1 Tax=Apiospora rasikravindrae TaxID=990691 RepID=A0ABR1S1V4_9PEZI